MTTDIKPELVTYQEAGQLLGTLSARSVCRMADKGLLRRVYPCPRSPRIVVSSIYEFVRGESQTHATTPKGTIHKAPQVSPKAAKAKLSQLLRNP